jgi:creatinine amidohydrolase
MRSIQYELMRPPDIVKERARAPLAFIPIGPLEWHGPHLPMVLKTDGYRLLIIVNGHGAVNHQRTLRRLAAEESDPPGVQILYAMAFLPAEPPFSDPGHAEKVETSIILATHPELVDVSALPPKGVPIKYRDFGIVDGKAFDGSPTPDFTLRSESDPRDASAELGRRVLDAEIIRLATVVQEHLRSLSRLEGA